MIAIVACGSNFASIQFALERLGKSSVVTLDPKIIESASHVILPGVGHAHYAMEQLKQNNLIEVIPRLTQPVLGICLGMQLFFTASMEGNIKCLGLLPETVLRFPEDKQLVTPHMGWNQFNITQTTSPMVTGISNQDFVYFVHNYYVPVSNATVALTNYAVDFSAIVQHKNFYGMQFHPEKSGKTGERLLSNFLNVRP
jgi:glutamine amidotransferase